MLARLNIIINSAAAQRSLAAFQRSVDGTARHVANRARSMAGAFQSVVSAVFGLRGALGALGLGLVTRSIVNTTLQIDRLKIALNSTRQNMEVTTQRFNALRKMSNDLGVDFVVTAGAFKNFGLAAEQAGINTDETERIFKSFVTAGAAMQMTNEQLEGSLTAVAQMFSKSKVSAEELRGQLGERMPVAFGMAAEAMGLTSAELDKALSLGNIMADDMVPKLATALQEKFGESAKSASKSATAQFNRFNNALTDLQFAIGSSGLVAALALAAGKITEFIQNAPLDEYFATVITGIAGFLRGTDGVINAVTRITGGIGDVFNELAGLYNQLNDFTGGNLLSMGLLGFIFIGGKKGGFIGVLIAILAAASDRIIIFVQETLAMVLTKAQGMFTDTRQSFAERASGSGAKRFLRNNTEQSYNQRMIDEGFTMAADGSFSRRSNLPGASAAFDSLQLSIDRLAQSNEKIAKEGLLTKALNEGLGALMDVVGLGKDPNLALAPGGGASGALIEPETDSVLNRAANALEDFSRRFAENMRNNRAGADGGVEFGAGPGAGGSNATPGAGSNFSAFGKGVADAFEQMKVGAQNFQKLGLDMVVKGFGFLDNAIDGFINGTKVSFKAFVSDMLAMLAKLLMRMMVFKALTGTKIGNTLGLEGTGFFGSSPGGQGAGGGSMGANRGYLVGERGPEMFFPRTGGHMVPNNELGGGGGVVINNHYDFSNADESVAARLQQTAETIKQETFNTVFGAIEHGGRFAKATGRR